MTLPVKWIVASTYTVPSSDGSEIYQFDGLGRHLETLDALTGDQLYEFTYDTDGMLTQIIDRKGNITEIERDSGGNPTAIVSPYGLSTSLSFNSNGFLDTITNPANEAWQFTNTDDGLITSRIDPNGNTSTYTFDSLGRLVMAEDAVGGSQTLTRTELTNGYEVTRTTEMGRVATYRVESTYPGWQNVTNTTPCGCQSEVLIEPDGSQTFNRPDGIVVTTQLGPDPRFGMQAPIFASMDVSTPDGLTLSIGSERTATLVDENDLFSLQTLTDTTNINGRTLTRVFDVANRTLTKTTPEGRTRVETFNEQQQPIESTVGSLEPVQISYNTDGQIASIVQETGAETRELSITYNSNGFISSITDPMLRSIDFEYDAVGRVTSQTITGGPEILFDYDAKGNLTAITPPGRPAHNFVYTSVDRPLEYAPPELGITPVDTTYVHNLDRQLTQIQRPDGETLDIDYDSAGRLSSRTLPRGTVGYTYDGTSGLLSEIVAPGGETLSFDYDGSLFTEWVWNGTVSGSVEQTYDNNFHIVSRSVNDANTIAYTYDQDGLMTQAGSLNITRDSVNGYISGTTLGSATDSQSYNGFGERINYTASYSGSPRFSTQYTRDKLGRITEKSEIVEGTANTYNYTYDTVGRLTEVQKDSIVIEAYAYDDNGNRLTADGINATYDSQDRLTQFGATAYTYTNNGELNTKTIGTDTTTYAYDVLGNLMQVILPDGTQIDYIIDGVNHRIGKKINGSLIQGFLYKDQLNPVAELDGSGSVVSRFIYASKTHVPDYMIKGGSTFRIISDHLGSPRLVIDIATGTTVQRIDYDSFGNVVNDTSPGFQPFAFAGGLNDSDTKLLRFGVRDYDVSTGRWTAKDPILFNGRSTNLYGYVTNEPVNYIDPIGMVTIAPNPGLGPTGASSGVEAIAGLIAGEIFDTGIQVLEELGVLQEDSVPNIGTGLAEPIVEGWAELLSVGDDIRQVQNDIRNIRQLQNQVQSDLNQIAMDLDYIRRWADDWTYLMDPCNWLGN